MEQVRVRVAVYVTRGDEVLVFDHIDFPEAGVQIPAGGIEPGERLEDAVVREVGEETGVRSVNVKASLGVQQRPHPDTGAPRVTVFYHATAAEARDRWAHMVQSGLGGDDGLRFQCYFLPIVDCFGLLADGQDELLTRLGLAREQAPGADGVGHA